MESPPCRVVFSAPAVGRFVCSAYSYVYLPVTQGISLLGRRCDHNILLLLPRRYPRGTNPLLPERIGARRTMVWSQPRLRVCNRAPGLPAVEL